MNLTSPMKKAFAIVLAALICAASLSACSSGGNVTLTVWCSELDKAMITGMVESFMATKPGIKGVDVQVCEDDNARERFEDNPSAAADILCIPHDQLGALVAEGYLAEITEAKHRAEIEKNATPAVSAGQIEGKQYGFPSSFETHMLFYDKSYISDAAAQTLDGILSSALPDDAFHFAMDFGNAYFTANWFFTYGCRLFGESGEDKDFCDFDSSAGVAAMTYLIEHRDQFGNLDGDGALAMFSEHKLGAFIGGPWNAAVITNALKGNYGCAALPGVDGKDMKSFAGFKLYCVNANTKNKAAAMDLAAWLANPGNQRTRFEKRNLIPVSASLANDADVAASTTAKAVMSQGPNAIAMPSIPEMSNFWSPTGAFTLACYTGEIGIPALEQSLAALVMEIKGDPH
ncbi:MAG: extracellular solute-binding protein [Clostridiales bacterium]|nr:extracellular solute-binding protein [Clostridiales bacterium]